MGFNSGFKGLMYCADVPQGMAVLMRRALPELGYLLLSCASVYWVYLPSTVWGL